MHFSDFLLCKPVPGDASVSGLIWLWECKISCSQSGSSWPTGWWRGGTESTSDHNTRDSLRWYGVMRRGNPFECLKMSTPLRAIWGCTLFLKEAGWWIGELLQHQPSCLGLWLQECRLQAFTAMMGQTTSGGGPWEHPRKICGSAQTRITVLFICRLFSFSLMTQLEPPCPLSLICPPFS